MDYSFCGNETNVINTRL